GENIFLAASDPSDILTYTPLNASSPILTSSKGTLGLRDPFITRAPTGDKFFLLATDLSIGRGMSFTDAQRVGSRYIEVWESPDLVHWSEQRHVLVAPPEAGNAWAPEAYFDEGEGTWFVFWASSLYDEDDVEHAGKSYNRVMYATTSDFVEFSEARVWQDAGGSRYDSTVIEVDGVYHRFTKDDSGNATGCRDIIHEKSSNLSAGLEGWDVVASCISSTAGVGEIEGPAVVKSNSGDVNGEKYFLFVDEFTGRSYSRPPTPIPSHTPWRRLPTFDRDADFQTAESGDFKFAISELLDIGRILLHAEAELEKGRQRIERERRRHAASHGGACGKVLDAWECGWTRRIALMGAEADDLKLSTEILADCWVKSPDLSRAIER
ncbi:hypothetical protein K4K48_012322, partial [Colletotrichum sp. SAR 10_66]